MIMREIKALFSALEFLTCIPVPSWIGWEKGRLDRAATWFPMVGIIVGIVAALIFALTSAAFSPLIAALLTICGAILVTGALHEDGLADFADGIGGGRDREQALSIMKDSRIGSYGTVTLGLAIALKVAALATMAPVIAIPALIAAHGLSRCQMRLAALGIDYARPAGDAKVAPLAPKEPPTRTGFLLIVTLLALLPALFGAPTLGVILAVALALLAGFAVRFLMRRRLGGWTGDCLGAVQQASETAFLIGASLWTSI